MGGLNFIDSAGLQALLSLQQEAGTAGLKFPITEVSPSVSRLITLAGVEYLLLPSHDGTPPA